MKTKNDLSYTDINHLAHPQYASFLFSRFAIRHLHICHGLRFHPTCHSTLVKLKHPFREHVSIQSKTIRKHALKTQDTTSNVFAHFKQPRSNHNHVLLQLLLPTACPRHSKQLNRSFPPLLLPSVFSQKITTWMVVMRTLDSWRLVLLLKLKLGVVLRHH